MPDLVGSPWKSFVRTLRQLVVSKLFRMVGVHDFGDAFLLQLRRDSVGASGGKLQSCSATCGMSLA